jgi:hypothetical protein
LPDQPDLNPHRAPPGTSLPHMSALAKTLGGALWTTPLRRAVEGLP